MQSSATRHAADTSGVNEAADAHGHSWAAPAAPPRPPAPAPAATLAAQADPPAPADGSAQVPVKAPP
eukprot:8974533-Lingulodinium_polyedra.AAC.1